MQEGQTRDGIKLFYEKNEKGSVIGQFVLYDIYDTDNVLLGERIGVRDLVLFDFKELFNSDGMIKDMREEYKKRKPAKVEKPVKEKKIKQEETHNIEAAKAEVNEETKPKESKSKKKSEPAESYESTDDGYIESQISIRLHLKGKRRVSVEQVIDLLKTKWQVDGYDIKMDQVMSPEQAKEISKKDDEAKEEENENY